MEGAAEVVVLATDWDAGDNPVVYYGTNAKGCLDFSSQPAKPRDVLTELRRKNMFDCEHGVSYKVVICKVKQ